MKIYKRAILVICICVWILAGCGEYNYKASTFFAMDTAMSMSVYGTNCERAVKLCESEIYRLDELLSATNKRGEVFCINEASGSFVDVSAETAFIIAFAKQMSESTDYAFDISVFPLVKAWGFYSKDYRIPSDEEISNLLTLVGSDSIEILGDSVKLRENQEIELGAIAKGYLTDKILNIFNKYEIKKAVVSLGGNVLVLGEKNKGEPWRVGIEDPFNPHSAMGVLTVTDTMVITSGDYQRYFEYEGKRYSHIFNPSSGRPVDNGLVSATVIMLDGMKADALSTALFVMGKEKATEYWRNHRDFEMILITSEKDVYITPDLRGFFSLNEDTEYTLHILDC